MKKTTKKTAAAETKPADVAAIEAHVERTDAADAADKAKKKARAAKAKPASAPAKGKATKKAIPAKKAPKAPKAAKKAAGVPREFSKTAIIADLIGRKGGATLPELLKATGWQKHSVRGFISTFGKKHTIESSKNEQGERCYALKA